MTIDFNCTACGTYLKASDHLVGRVLRCYKCGGLFTVPKASTVTAPARPAAAPPELAPPPMPVLAPLPPPIAASAAPPAPALAGPAEFELPPDLALDDLGTAPQPAADDLVAVDDLLIMDEEPPKGNVPAPAGGVDDFDPADILLLEEEPPSKDKKK